MFQALRSFGRFVLPLPVRNMLRSSYRWAMFQVRFLLQRLRRRPIFSLVVAAHNVEPYIGELLSSIDGQGLPESWVEVIVVNDCSTDATAQVVQQFALTSRYPIRLISLPQNQGVSVARNTGLAQAQGLWISFPDGDDFVGDEYLEGVWNRIRSLKQKNLLSVPTNVVLFHEKTQTTSNHPLAYRFQGAGRVAAVKNLDGHFVLTVNANFLSARHLRNSGVMFQSGMVIGEDALFTTTVYSAYPNALVAFVPESKYFYRKRASATSALGSNAHQPIWFLDVVRHLFLPTMRAAAGANGTVPTWLQKMAIYDIAWRVRALIDQPGPSLNKRFTAAETEELWVGWAEIISYVDPEILEQSALGGMRFEYRVGLLAQFKNAFPAQPRIELRNITGTDLYSFDEWYLQEDDAIQLSVDGVPREPVESKTSVQMLLGKKFYYRRRSWYRLQHFERLSFATGKGLIAQIYSRKAGLVRSDMVWDLFVKHQGRELSALVGDESFAQFRAHAVGKLDVVLMDRIDRASDNAEFLYEYLRQAQPELRIAYVLARNSTDWDRLQELGFHLLPYGSVAHLSALCSATVFASSHIDAPVLTPVNFRKFHQAFRYQFVFLQHGVIKDDLSHWLNLKPIRKFITSTRHEFNDVRADDGCYVFTRSEVVLTGLPRFDRLLGRSKKRSVVIAPTWRKALDGLEDLADFQNSSYYQAWQSALESSAITELVNANYEVTLVLHPKTRKWAHAFQAHPEVRVLSPAEEVDYTELLGQAELLLTDYSSVAFDAAYAGAVVMYYQFDKAAVFSGGHTVAEGYFDYQTDGFGPVLTTHEELDREIRKFLKGEVDPEYERRRQETFTWIDQRNCERVTEVILEVLKEEGSI